MSESEQNYILETFLRNFSRFRKDPIILYGLGINTKLILDNLSGFRIVGLMDPDRIGDTVMGLPVLSPQEVPGRANIIIIIARLNVVEIIYERIANLEQKHGVAIYDINGNRPGQKHPAIPIASFVDWKCTANELINQISAHDLITFDIFDTLIMRKVVFPRHIFDIVDKKLQNEQKKYFGFSAMRITAEQELLAENRIPTLSEIYDRFQAKTGISDRQKKQLQRLEFAVEFNQVVPRKRIVELFHKALRAGKTVILLSDMYLPENLMRKLLRHCGIEGYTELLISCDVRATKHDGSLYQFLKTKFSLSNWLHIGDNPTADIQQAEKYGATTCRVFSGYDMLLNSSYKRLMVNLPPATDSALLGVWLAHAFNDPFALIPEKGKPVVDTPYALGYLYLGPLMLCFLNWLCKELKNKGYKKILFFARDGFLLEQLYKEMIFHDDSEHYPTPIYFLTSRRAASVAAIRNKEDILALLQKPFHCTKGELLQNRFGVIPAPVDSRRNDHIVSSENMADAEEYILTYQNEILKNAADERKSYLDYISRIGIIPEEKIAVFDLVSSGTTQYYLSRIAGRPFDGFYFATANLPNDFFQLGEISAFLGNSLVYYAPAYQACRYYLLLESILTSPEHSLVRCYQDGSFCYRNSSERARNYAKLEECHKGIRRYIADSRKSKILPLNHPRKALRLADQIYGYLFQPETQVSQTLKNLFTMESEFDCTPEYRVWDCLFSGNQTGGSKS